MRDVEQRAYYVKKFYYVNKTLVWKKECAFML